MACAIIKYSQKLIGVVSVAMFYASCYAQVQPPVKNVQEEVYLHLNTTLFLAGETILFTGYSVSSNSHKLSRLSKIVYVELLDAKNTAVFKTKISLDNGVGHGEYFINSLLSTGQYTLVAYTRWMKNFDDFFYQPITIINPFEAYEPPPKAQQVLASFYPEGGAFITGTLNNVVCHVRNENGKGLNLSGKLVNGHGDKILDFTSESEGINRFVFTPEDREKYQVILEDEDSVFHFFALPESVKGAYCKITKKESRFVIEIKCSTSLKGNKANLTLKNRQNTFVHKEVDLGLSYVFAATDFPRGTLLAVLETTVDGILSQRQFQVPDSRSLLLLNDRHPVYSKRQKVSWDYDIGSNASLSISVRKKNLPISFERANIIYFMHMITDFCNENVDSRKFPMHASPMFYDNLMIMSSWKEELLPNGKAPVKWLPEYRHDLIGGYLLCKDSYAIPDKFVSLSLSGKNYQIAIGKTDETGRFVIPVNPPDKDGQSFIKALGMDSLAYNINIIPEFRNDYPPFYHEHIVLDSQTVAGIVQKSIYNQIENAYIDLLSPVEEVPEQPFFTHFDYDDTFFLDDYTRFPSMREVFHEYIPLASVSKDENNFKLSYRILDLPQQFLKKDLLILLDGVPVSTKQALTTDPYKIESINLANHRHYLGPYIADGVISIHTYEGDVFSPQVAATMVEYNYVGIQPKRVYNFPNHTIPDNTKFPDKRDQLFWVPQVDLQKGEPLKLEFFTSDVTGNFQIDIEGVSDKGELISIRDYFSVK